MSFFTQSCLGVISPQHKRNLCLTWCAIAWLFSVAVSHVVSANVLCSHCSRTTSISPIKVHSIDYTRVHTIAVSSSSTYFVLALHVPGVHIVGGFVSRIVRMFKVAGTLFRGSWRTKLNRPSVPT